MVAGGYVESMGIDMSWLLRVRHPSGIVGGLGGRERGPSYD